MSPPLYFGIEIGGTKLQLAIGRGDGRLLDVERRRVAPARGAVGIRAQISEMAAAVLERNALRSDAIEAVGIGFGGPVDAKLGVVTKSNQIEGWADFPLGEWTRRALEVDRVVVENDADAAALGESRFGAGIDRNPLLYVTIGSGIGGGLVLDGAIYRGSGRGAVEIGQLLLGQEFEGPHSNPLPDRPSIEGLSSGWSIGRRARQSALGLRDEKEGYPETPLLRLCGGDPARIDAELVHRAAIEGDPMAIEVLDAARRALAAGLAHAITLMAPARIVLGGGVSQIGQLHWFEPIRLATDSQVFRPLRGSYDIVPSLLGEDVVLHGAVALATEATRPGS